MFIFLRSQIESKAFMMIDGGVFINGLLLTVVLEDIASFPPFILKFLIVNISSYFGLLGFVRYYRQHWSWLICDTKVEYFFLLPVGTGQFCNMPLLNNSNSNTIHVWDWPGVAPYPLASIGFSELF